MKNNKGISLIVLVITIVVIIILTGAIVLSISNNNPIQQASHAVLLSDKATIQDAFTMYVGKLMAENSTGTYTISGDSVTITASNLTVYPIATAKIAIGSKAETLIFTSAEIGMTVKNPSGYSYAIDATGMIHLFEGDTITASSTEVVS